MELLRHKEQYYQCNQCGNIHSFYMDEVEDLGDGIFYEIICPQCRDATKHLCVGDDEFEKYMYYDPVLDSRYY